MLNELESGTLVETPSDGIGEVVDTVDGLISVRLKGGGMIDLDIAATESATTIVSPDGLRALTYRSPDEVQSLAVDSPLRLIVLTLGDSALAMKMSELRTQIEPLLTDISWGTWWSRVRPALVDSELIIQVSGGFLLKPEVSSAGVSWVPLSDLGVRESQSRTPEEIDEHANDVEVGDVQLVEFEAPVRQRVVTRLLDQGRVGWITSQSPESLVSLSDTSWSRILANENSEISAKAGLSLLSAVPQVLAKSEQGGDFRRLATRSVNLMSATLPELSRTLSSWPDPAIVDTLVESVRTALLLNDVSADGHSSQVRKSITRFINETIRTESRWADQVADSISTVRCSFSVWRIVFDEVTDGLPPDQYGQFLWIVLKSKPDLPGEFLRDAVAAGRNSGRVMFNLASAFSREGTSVLALGAGRVADLLLESPDRTSLPRDQISEVLALALIIDSEHADKYADPLARNLQRAVSRDVGSDADAGAAIGIIDVVRMAIRRLQAAAENRMGRERRAHDRTIAELENSRSESTEEWARKVRELEVALSRAESSIESNLAQFANQRSRDRFNAQRILLETVASEWQELTFLTGGDTDSGKRNRVLASRLMDILSRSNVKQVDQKDDKVTFDLTAHSLVPGASRASGDMTVMAPGLQWSGPDDELTTLVKTLVKPAGE